MKCHVKSAYTALAAMALQGLHVWKCDRSRQIGWHTSAVSCELCVRLEGDCGERGEGGLRGDSGGCTHSSVTAYTHAVLVYLMSRDSLIRCTCRAIQMVRDLASLQPSQ